jgi:hypothetical protein
LPFQSGKSTFYGLRMSTCQQEGKTAKEVGSKHFSGIKKQYIKIRIVGGLSYFLSYFEAPVAQDVYILRNRQTMCFQII